MIKINSVSPKNQFSLIDFEFQNASEEEISLSEFIVNIQALEIDKTPFLIFRYDIENNAKHDSFWSKEGDLVIYVKNNGFGAITLGYVEIDGPVLNELIPLEYRCFKGIHLAAGEEVKITTFIGSNLTMSFNDNKIEIQAKWMGFKENNHFTLDKDGIYGGDIIADVFIKNSCFRMKKTFLQRSINFESDVNCIMLDLGLETTKVRSFPIAKEIGPGEREMFTILVGAEKSAFITLNLKFKTGQKVIFNSKPFEITVFNPIGLYKHDSYVDRDVLEMKINPIETGDEGKNISFK